MLSTLQTLYRIGKNIAIVAVLIFVVYHSFFRKEDPDHPRSVTRVSDDNRSLIEVRKSYWPDGKLKEETPYKKRYRVGYKKLVTTLVPHGVSKQYDQNGTLILEDPYVDGKREGLLKTYWSSGRLKTAIPYKEDKREGIAKIYREDGSLEMTVRFRNGKRNGQTCYYDRNASGPSTVEYYRDGELVFPAQS